jgi:hypothetical protein
MIGSKRAEIESRPEDMMSKIKLLHNRGIECIFMSSLGPALVIISLRDEDRVIEELVSLNFEMLHRGKIVTRSALSHSLVEYP